MRAPAISWDAAQTLRELVVAVLLIGAFVANETRAMDPLVPLSIFHVRGSRPRTQPSCSARLFARIGAKPVIVAGSVIAGGLYYLSRIPAHRGA